jgi:hypothetical protein
MVKQHQQVMLHNTVPQRQILAAAPPPRSRQTLGPAHTLSNACAGHRRRHDGSSLPSFTQPTTMSYSPGSPPAVAAVPVVERSARPRAASSSGSSGRLKFTPSACRPATSPEAPAPPAPLLGERAQGRSTRGGSRRGGRIAQNGSASSALAGASGACALRVSGSAGYIFFCPLWCRAYRHAGTRIGTLAVTPSQA